MERPVSARYALWRGDRCIDIGTAKQLAERHNIKPKTVYWLASPANKRRGNNRIVAERI